jgi:2-amino-4-hydroxy-6-hydroxymethyldihydropteridine diphosphokinase
LNVLLGLGSNLGNSRAVLEGSLERLGADGRIIKTSRLWSTRAIGPKQPDYLNAVVLIDWPSRPSSLLKLCLALEAAAGRNRSGGERWGPRVLDLDLLLAENVVCRGPTLELPHPRFHIRRFALDPAAEVAAEWVHPLLGLTIAELADEARRREPDAILDVTSFELRVKS